MKFNGPYDVQHKYSTSQERRQQRLYALSWLSFG